nr:uncharacterized protein CFP56_35163 [Quercus suber]
MDDILHDWRKLSLTEEEDTKLNLSKSKNLRSKEYVLAAKFLTRRALNVEAIGRTFKPLWRAKKEFKVREAGDHILLFVFELESDAERVLANEPWTFDKHVVLLQRFDGSTPARYLRFTKLKIWVQIHGLPMRMLDSETAIEIGETLGQVTPCENLCEQVGGDFLRIQVEIDVSKPLCRGRRIALDETEEIWISFKYEKLPNFCYWCGLISHDGKDCEVWLAKKDSGKTEPHEYGPWLRAIPYNSGKTPYVVVPGMGDGLGGTPRPDSHQSSKKSSETTEKATWENSDRSTSGEKGGVDLRNAKYKEVRDPGEQITLKGREYGSPLNEIQELDLEINKFDKGEAHVEHTSVGVSHAPPTNERQVAPSMQTFEPLDQPHHVTESSPSSNQGSQTLRTWRRLARDNPMKIDQPQSPTVKKRSRGEEKDYLHELPIKKAQVSKGESQKNLMAEAAQQSRQEQ